MARTADSLRIAIDTSIGPDMAGCRACRGISGVTVDCDVDRPPRGLILEEPTKVGRGSIVAGMNPGLAAPDEREFYERANEPPYVAQQLAFRTIVQNPYYDRLRGILEQLGLGGPILWTDVVKCEKMDKASPPPGPLVQRTCVTSFLSKELAAAPGHWPVIACGEEAFRALSLLALDRVVIGLPHPTGAFPQFSRILLKDSSGKPLARPYRLTQQHFESAKSALEGTAAAVQLRG